MADNPTYAMVDMSKKNHSHLMKGSAGSSVPDSNLPLYANYNLDKNANPRLANEELPANYSMITLEDMASVKEEVIDSLHASPVRSTTAIKNIEEKVKNGSSTSNKRFALLLVTIAIVIVFIVFACLAFMFAEIAKLKSEAASFSQVTSSQQQQNYSMIIALLQQLNHNISLLDTLQQDMYSILNHNVSMLDDRITKQGSFLRRELNGKCSAFPASSCAALPPSSPSGYYWVRASSGSAVRVYCDMTRSCGGVIGGWMRVAELDMRNSSHQCPRGFREHNVPNIRTCVRFLNPAGCSEITYPTANQYSNVCGRITAYWTNTPDGFRGSGRSNPTINSNYVDGVSLTRGNLKEHVWTFAAISSVNHAMSVPSRPSFVETSDYFCDFSPLISGAVCSDRSIYCCTLNNPPWFYKQLLQPTTDNIEMRVCRDQNRDDEDIAIEIIEIYVQ